MSRARFVRTSALAALGGLEEVSVAMHGVRAVMATVRDAEAVDGLTRILSQLAAVYLGIQTRSDMHGDTREERAGAWDCVNGKERK